MVSSDGSKVCGTEVQGMLMDIFLSDGSIETSIFPGASMAHLMTREVDKAIALLRVVWLVAGPSAEKMQRFFSLVRSITTDCGTELFLADSPNYLQVFLHGCEARL